MNLPSQTQKSFSSFLSPCSLVKLFFKVVEFIFKLFVSEQVLKVENDAAVLVDSRDHIVAGELPWLIEMAISQRGEFTTQSLEPRFFGQFHVLNKLSFLFIQHVVDVKALALSFIGPSDLIVPSPQILEFFFLNSFCLLIHLGLVKALLSIPKLDPEKFSEPYGLEQLLD